MSIFKFIIVFCVGFTSLSYAQDEEAIEEGEPIVVTAPISASDRRKVVRRINDIIEDNARASNPEADSPRRYFNRLMNLDDYIFRHVNNMNVFPEICERLHPRNIAIAEAFRAAGWRARGFVSHPKNFDTSFIKDYYKNMCEAAATEED